MASLGRGNQQIVQSPRGVDERLTSAVLGTSIALDEATKRGHLFAQSGFADRDGVDSQILLVGGGRPPDDEETGASRSRSDTRA